MKKIISLLLVLIIIFSIVFQCSTTSYAIAGVDDVVVLGVCLDLLALGISIYSVQEFCKSDAFRDFCTDIGNHVESGISSVKRSGKLFVATSKMAWQDICNWVKSKFSGIGGTKNIEFDVTRPSHPSTITLKNGMIVPYADFMEHPFLIYTLPNGTTRAWYCSGENPGVNINNTMLRMLCTGNGKCYRYTLENGVWGTATSFNMTYGWNYKGTTGAFYDINFSLSSLTGTNIGQCIQYRTLEYCSDSGTPYEESQPNLPPIVDSTVPATVTMTSDPAYYPGAVDSPTETIENGESILIEVPENLVIDSGTSNPTLTTDIDAIGQTLSQTTSSQVNPRVLTQTSSVSGTIDQVITDTPSVDIEAGVNEPASDLETANKFRLPKSFLEGFPFSIPYSVYVGIQSLVADPQAPAFNIPFSIPRLGISENVDIDLSQFSPVARLCRALLSLVWVAGLAMACSKFIKR